MTSATTLRQYTTIAQRDFVLSLPGTTTKLVRDRAENRRMRKSLRTHIESGDFFAVLAMLFEVMAERERSAGHGSTILENLRRELKYLHTHYTIVPKTNLRDTKRKKK